MTLRMLSLFSQMSLKESYFRHFNIHLENTNCLEELKEKLMRLEEGAKKINLIYKNIEISSGFSIKNDINLENIIQNIEGIKNIEKIM